jgi:hypothetical protein
MSRRVVMPAMLDINAVISPSIRMEPRAASMGSFLVDSEGIFYQFPVVKAYFHLTVFFTGAIGYQEDKFEGYAFKLGLDCGIGVNHLLGLV